MESVRINISMIRRRILVPHLGVGTIPLGHLTQTDVEIIYIERLVNEGMLQEVDPGWNEFR